MKSFKSTILLILVLVWAISQGEARRTILKGRKAITRDYFRDTGLASWAIVILVALGEVIIGALLYIVLKLTILDPEIKPRFIRIASPPNTP